MAGLFRRSAVKRLSQPEQPGKPVITVSPMSWLALIGIALILILTFSWFFFGKIPVYISCEGIITSPESSGAIFANSAGIVEDLFVSPGNFINEGDEIAVIVSPSGRRNPIISEVSGTVSVLLVGAGDPVTNGSEIIRITPPIDSDKAAVFFIPLPQSQDLMPGMRAVLSPVSDNYSNRSEAKIVYTGKYASSINNLSFVLGEDNNMSRLFLGNDPICTVVCVIDDDSAFSPNTIVKCRIIVEETTPFLRMIHGQSFRTS